MVAWLLLMLVLLMAWSPLPTDNALSPKNISASEDIFRCVLFLTSLSIICFSALLEMIIPHLYHQDPACTPLQGGCWQPQWNHAQLHYTGGWPVYFFKCDSLQITKSLDLHYTGEWSASHLDSLKPLSLPGVGRQPCSGAKVARPSSRGTGTWPVEDE